MHHQKCLETKDLSYLLCSFPKSSTRTTGEKGDELLWERLTLTGDSPIKIFNKNNHTFSSQRLKQSLCHNIKFFLEITLQLSKNIVLSHALPLTFPHHVHQTISWQLCLSSLDRGWGLQLSLCHFLSKHVHRRLGSGCPWVGHPNPFSCMANHSLVSCSISRLP